MHHETFIDYSKQLTTELCIFRTMTNLAWEGSHVCELLGFINLKGMISIKLKEMFTRQG